METLLDLTAQMAREGVRRLLVLSGDEHWCLAQAVELRERLGGDSLWVGALPQQEPGVAPGALKTLLGREFLHAFFDAR
ncbi:tRNA cytosine(34) acetyltransferase TmcA, partial [Klebsiella aerogenes]|nr:tRNA cytosine(34) acetyltransferase TmcA [Klebsiella aerogenes]